MNKIKVSEHQLVLTTSGFVFGSSPLILASSVTQYAKQDAWISALLASIIGLLFIWLYTYLGSLYPDKTIVEIIQLLLGKWLGGFVALNFIITPLFASAQVTWFVGDFMTTQYLTKTPFYIINILFLIGIVIALLYGLEATFRAREVFFSVTFPLFCITLLLLLPNAKTENLFPIMGGGIPSVLKGMVPILTFAVWPLIFLNMIYPVNVSDIRKAKKAIFKGYLTGIFITFFSILICILVLGNNLTSCIRFPLFYATKEINVGIIFTRLEAIIAFVWLTAIFISVFIYFYAGLIGLSQLLKLKNYRKIVLPLGLVIAILSGIGYPNVPFEIRWDAYVLPPFSFTWGAILPVLLLIITGIRKCLKIDSRIK